MRKAERHWRIALDWEVKWMPLASEEWGWSVVEVGALGLLGRGAAPIGQPREVGDGCQSV